MSYSNGIIKAPVVLNASGGDIGQAIGVSSGDLGTLCGHANNNPWNVYKPIPHQSNDYVTLAQRIQKFHGLTPKDMTSHFRTYDIGGSSTFATVPTPEAWGRVLPSGTLGTAPFRAFDYVHIETDLSQIASANGYDINAQAPLLMSSDVTVTLSTDPDQGDVLCPTFKYNEESANAYGTAHILLYLRDLIFRYYGNRDNVSAWKLPASYDDIFNANGSLTTGVWRFAIALAVMTAAGGPYKWQIVSSPSPLSKPFASPSDTSVFLSHVIRPSYNQAVADNIKYAVRNYGQTRFDCIPFLACNLKYTAARGWYFSGGTELAVTFPLGDTFKLTPTGFPSAIDVSYVSFRVAWTSTNSASQSITGLTWYNGTVEAQGSQVWMAISLPRPTANYCIMELTFNINTHFGKTTNMVAGMLVNSGQTAGKLFTNDGSAIDNISGDWTNSAHTYKVRCMGANLRTLMANTSTPFPYKYNDGFDMYFDNTQLASRQHKLEAGIDITLAQ